MGDLAEFEIVEILSEEYTRNVDFLDLYAIILDASSTQKAMRITQVYRKDHLPGNLSHLRICKSVNDGKVALIYGDGPETPFLNDLKSEDISVYDIIKVRVPKYPPYTHQQYRDWVQYWPLRFNRPNWQPLAMTEQVRQEMLKFIKVAIDVFKNRIIAKCSDKRNEHVLKHAAMLAIDHVAQLQLKSPKHKRKNCLQMEVESNKNINADGPEYDIGLPEYLCTGCQVYMSHEPCCMCGMALLHARISSGVYRNTNQIAISIYNMHRYRLSPNLHILGAVERLHIAYSRHRFETADIARFVAIFNQEEKLIRRLVIFTSGRNLLLKFPQLRVTWEILDYDSPASMSVKFLDGTQKRLGSPVENAL
ncbi:bifunctional Cytidine deaminase-like/Cytidine and deoxycytidylate deaminase domain [Babesia duncani]|uniref:Bifunctional Cytidine deaminase-like/Cytidine and deoxycytidylate deaminase domain n=1 Tax=Babesia duncani TaxID=323732 RepID=A0AAD9PJU3_9APIC|nr:bifunctional Cytidine deaminase-like/Cytidine and deoxycytidylate deaminase domain [Babesia duncani]